MALPGFGLICLFVILFPLVLPASLIQRHLKRERRR